MLDYTVLTNKNASFVKKIERFDLSESINHVLEILDENLKLINVKVKVTFKGFVDGTRVATDRNRFQQVLLNVLSNSIKYTNKNSSGPGLFEIIV